MKECASNVECQSAFGLGTSCDVEMGLCRVEEMHPRCDSVFPADTTFPIDPNETHVVASLFGRDESNLPRRDATQMAIDQANLNGGVGGRDFAIIHCNYDPVPSDELESNEAAVAVSQWLTDNVGVRGLLGPAGSAPTTAVYVEVAERTDTLIVSPSATADSLVVIDGELSTDVEPGLFWRTAPPDASQSVAIFEDMRNQFDPEQIQVYRPAPTDNLAILFEEGPYGLGLASTIGTLLEGEGGEYTLFPFTSDVLGVRVAELANSPDGPFDEILFVSGESQDYVDFLTAATNNDAYSDVPLFFSDGGQTEAIFNTIGPLKDHLRGSGPTVPGGVVFQAFDAQFLIDYGVSALDHQFIAHSYDAASMMVYAHEWALHNEADFSGTSLARGFRKMDGGTEFDISASTLPSLASRFSSGQGVDLTGASGELEYKDDIGELFSSIEIWKIEGQGQNREIVGLYVYDEAQQAQ